MIKSHRVRHHFAVTEFFIAVLAFLVVLLLGSIIFYKMTDDATKTAVASSVAQATKSNSDAYTILVPATARPRIAECSEKISYSENGNSGPIQCPNGELNVQEWNALAALEPTVMSLGYAATTAQVQAALCADANDSDADSNTKDSNIIEDTTYQITALYYGWNFTTNPSVVLSNGTC